MSTVLPRTLLLPPLPRTGDQELDRYLAALGDALSGNHQMVSERVEDLTDYGLAANRPGASGAGRFFYETDTSLLKFDTGAWQTIYNSAHTHDDRYFTETELLNGALDSRYYTESEIITLLAGYSLTSHTHDDRYYTETESDARFAPIAHTHDTRYYTESEVDTLLGSYLPLTAGSGKPLTGDLYLTNSSISLSADESLYWSSISYIYGNATRLTLGNSNYDSYIVGRPITLTSYGTGDFNLTSVGDINLTSNNDIVLNPGTNDKVLLGTTNSVPIQGKATTGTYYNLIRMDSSNRVAISEGSINVNFDTTGAIFLGNYGSACYLRNSTAGNHQLATVNGLVLEIGTSLAATTLLGSTVLLSGTLVKANGIKTGGGSATNARTGLGSGEWCMYRDTSGNKTYIACNYGGTAYAAELTAV